jgi:hypothetical protein
VTLSNKAVFLQVLAVSFSDAADRVYTAGIENDVKVQEALLISESREFFEYTNISEGIECQTTMGEMNQGPLAMWPPFSIILVGSSFQSSYGPPISLFHVSCTQTPLRDI